MANSKNDGIARVLARILRPRGIGVLLEGQLRVVVDSASRS